MGAQKSKLCENENYVQRRHQNLQDQSQEQRRKRRKWRKKQGYSLPTGLDTVGTAKTNNNIGITAASSHADIPDLDQDDAILVSYSQSNAEKFSHLRPLFANANRTALQRRASSEEPFENSPSISRKNKLLLVQEQDNDKNNIVVDHVQVIRVNSSSSDDDDIEKNKQQSINFTKKKYYSPPDVKTNNNIPVDRRIQIQTKFRETDIPNHNKTVVAINVNKSSAAAASALAQVDDDEISSINRVKNHVKNHDFADKNNHAENLKRSQDVEHEQEAHAILNVIELDSFKQISGIPSPKLDQEDIDLLNALMNNDNITLVKEPSFVIQTNSKTNNKYLDDYEDELSDRDHDRDRDRPVVDESTCTTAVAPPSPFTNVEQITLDQTSVGVLVSQKILLLLLLNKKIGIIDLHHQLIMIRNFVKPTSSQKIIRIIQIPKLLKLMLRNFVKSLNKKKIGIYLHHQLMIPPLLLCHQLALPMRILYKSKKRKILTAANQFPKKNYVKTKIRNFKK